MEFEAKIIQEKDACHVYLQVRCIPQGRTLLEKLPFLFLAVLWERKLAGIRNILLTEHPGEVCRGHINNGGAEANAYEGAICLWCRMVP